MGGGGALNKLFPSYKDKLFNKLPIQVRLFYINKINNIYNIGVYRQCIILNKRMQTYNKNILYYLYPFSSYSSPFSSIYSINNIDYKKQYIRGTLIEGINLYLPTKKEQKRLFSPFSPYTQQEQQQRNQYKYQSIIYYINICIILSIINNIYIQKRPISWCLEKEPKKAPKYPFWFKSVLHAHDIPSVRRGYEVYRKVCAACHSMEQLHFRHLVGEVLPEERMKEIAAQFDVIDGPNDLGEMYTRPGIINDSFPKPYPNEETARYANNGAYPPDLSLITSARKEGPDYIMSLLNGYNNPPPYNIILRPGLYYNTWFPGNAIAMAPPLQDELIEYEDGTPCNVSQMSKDVVNFLTWASEPSCDERKLFGLKAVSASFLGCILMTVWWRFFWVIYATRRIDFGKLKYL